MWEISVDDDTYIPMFGKAKLQAEQSSAELQADCITSGGVSTPSNSKLIASLREVFDLIELQADRISR